MGLTLSSIGNVLSSLTRWTKEKDVRILMLGLDSAGKVRAAVRLGQWMVLTALCVDHDII